MPTIPAEPAKDECYRCGYNLLGIADDQACPECGLLAQRSRRVTDELHDTRQLRTVNLTPSKSPQSAPVHPR